MIDGYLAGYDAWNECHPDNPEYKNDKAMSKIKCNCPCHKDPNFKHVQACCINGYVEMPDFTTSPKDQPEGQRLDIERFSELNRNRAAEGFKTYKNVPITYWTTALAGEVGELCNMIKKQERVAHGGIDGGSSYTAASLTPEDLKEEIGGIFIYLDLLSGLLGIDLTDAIIHTFNDKSEKYGFTQKYIPEETSSPAGQPIEWDSYRLIGRVRERFKELEAKGWNWRSFYNGWLEGRADMFAEIKGIKNHMEVFDIEEKILDELVHPLKQNFSGSNDYMSGVNDGLYTMARRLLEFQPNTSEAGMSQEDQRHIHVELPSGGVARVSPDASPELLGALDKMVELAKEMPEPAPALQGEIPEEITAAEILHKHMLLGRKNSYMHDAMEEYAQYKCDLLYHKMQEEIKEYRKALQNFVDKVDRGEARSKRSYAEMKDILAKYPQGKEGGK